MKVSHETPLKILDHSRNYNDFDYALVHLFPQYPEYFDFFVKSLEMGRRVILDNSVFELGEAYNPKEYEEWIKKLKPTYYIIPDKFGDPEATIAAVKEWSEKKLPGKRVGVLQGNTVEDFIRCYKEIEPLVDMIAVSFAQPLFEKMYPHQDKDHARMYGRHSLIRRMLKEGVINRNKPHHLLGCSLPQEVGLYEGWDFNFIKSIDTSSPVVHALRGVKFLPGIGLDRKLTIKMVDLFEKEISQEEIDLINYNVKEFKNLF